MPSSTPQQAEAALEGPGAGPHASTSGQQQHLHQQHQGSTGRSPWALTSSLALDAGVLDVVWAALPRDAKKAFSLTSRGFRDASRHLATALDLWLRSEADGASAAAFYAKLPRCARVRVAVEFDNLGLTAFLVAGHEKLAARLTELELHDQPVGAAMAALVAKSAPLLRSLAITLDAHSSLALASLRLCPHLVDLQCSVDSLSLVHTAGLSALTRLTSLELGCTSSRAPLGSPPTLAALSGLLRLQYLCVYGHDEEFMHASELRHLAGLASLEGLRLTQCVGARLDAAVFHLSGLVSLDFLYVCNDEEPVRLGAQGLAALGALTALTGLHINGLDSDLGSAPWSLPALKYINVSTEGYVPSLAQLAALARGCPSLVYVQNDVDAWQKRAVLQLPGPAAPVDVAEAAAQLHALHDRRLLESVHVQQLPDGAVLAAADALAASPPRAPEQQLSRVRDLECAPCWAATQPQLEWLFRLMPAVSRLGLRVTCMADLDAVLALPRLALLTLHELPKDAAVEDLCRFVGRLPAAGFTRLAVSLPSGALTEPELRAVRAVLQGCGAAGISLSVHR